MTRKARPSLRSEPITPFPFLSLFENAFKLDQAGRAYTATICYDNFVLCRIGPKLFQRNRQMLASFNIGITTGIARLLSAFFPLSRRGSFSTRDQDYEVPDEVMTRLDQAAKVTTDTDGQVSWLKGFCQYSLYQVWKVKERSTRFQSEYNP